MQAPHLPKVILYGLPSEDRPDRAMPADWSLQEEREKKIRLDRIAAQLPMLLWEASQEGKVTMAMGNALHYVDQPTCRDQALSLSEFFQTADPHFPPLAAHEAALGGQAVSFEFLCGERTFFGQTEPWFDDTGNLAGTISAALDVTEHKEKQKEAWQLQAALQEARRKQSLRTLAGGLAHRLNNILTAIMGYAALAERKLPADSLIREMVSKIDTASQCAADLVEQLLAFAEKCRIFPQNLQLTTVIQDLLPHLEMHLSSQVELKLDLAENLPMMKGDDSQLRRLILNLCWNAAEALGDSGGTIALRTQKVHANQAFLRETFMQEDLPEGDYLWLQVSDTGRGMDEETQGHLFEPFFSTKFIGRGLGLASAQGIVHAHHGGISVSTKPGLGTTIHVLLPTT